MDERAIGTRARHEGEIANFGGAKHFTDRNNARLATQLLDCRGHGIERDAEMTGERVCAAQWNDS